MPKKVTNAVAIVAILATLTSGCRSTQDYERLAQAGSAYVVAVDKLLEVEGDIRIDRTSEELLDLDRCINLERCRTVNRQTYVNFSNNDLERLKLLANIRTHNQLLFQYFSLLNQLAISNAPEQAQAAISNTITKLTAVSAQLKPVVGNQQFAGRITRLVVDRRIRGALKDELQNRKDTIQSELVLQQQLLDLLASNIEKNIGKIQKLRENRLVIEPLTDSKPISNGDAWIVNRRDIIKMETMAKELRDASDAADEFRGVFEDYVSGKITNRRINSFLTDVEELIKVTEDFKKVMEEQT